jgi:aminoglycoside phosphotransferase (APT) family kinase protein
MTDKSTGTRPITEKDGLDTARLATWMKDHVAGFSGELQVEKFKGGQSNPTFMLGAGGRKYVMRRKPPGKLLPSAHAVDREYKVISALAATDVPVAKTYALCTDDSVGHRHHVLHHGLRRRPHHVGPGPARMTPAQRGAIFDEMNRVIAALHKVDYTAVGLADYGKPGSYFARQIDRWSKQYRASETEKIEAMDKLIEWLPQNIPAGDETSIVHGDFRLDNTVFHPTEPRMLAVLDWELSTLGHPLADFAYHCMTWRLSPGQFRGLAGNDLAALGIPSEAEYVAAYCRRTGRAPIPPRDWEFCMAFNMFRLAGILQGIMARALQGNASSAEAIETGKRARPLAEEAWRQVERLLVINY